jgi:hypothetical protein
MNLKELKRQVQLQEDIQEIEHLQRKYAYYFDLQMWAEVLDLFSDNTESVELADFGVYYGKKGVRRMYWDITAHGGTTKVEGWDAWSIIQIGGVVDISPDGKSAQGRWQCWIPNSGYYGAFPRQHFMHGYYENKYVKENGKWLFSKLHWNCTLSSPVEDGWLNLPLLDRHPQPDADEPPTAFHPYPNFVGNAPFHFKHPITGE